MTLAEEFRSRNFSKDPADRSHLAEADMTCLQVYTVNGQSHSQISFLNHQISPEKQLRRVTASAEERHDRYFVMTLHYWPYFDPGSYQLDMNLIFVLLKGNLY